jgi:hypothetical protein
MTEYELRSDGRFRGPPRGTLRVEQLRCCSIAAIYHGRDLLLDERDKRLSYERNAATNISKTSFFDKSRR